MKLQPLFASFIAVSLSFTSCGDDNSDEPVQETPETPTPPADEPYITVLDYSPAPGQFVNVIPEYEAGDTRESVNEKATEMLNEGYMISLGAWGGSVTLKLSTPIRNIPGSNDFRVIGNAVYANASTEAVRYGSAEPGIIMVMQDSNGNGMADDEWYEITGDKTAEAVTGYTVTYYRPDENATDTEYIRWVASDGSTGYINRNSSYHTQDFFPMWLTETESLTFTGKRLPDNGYFNSETGNFDLMCYNGYADSHPNNADASQIDIDDAVDSNGNPANLSSIDFIRIYTAVLQANGPLGECSTEVAGIEPLNQQ